MTIIIELIHNKVFISAAAGWFIAQLLKILIEIAKGTFTIKRLAGGGGMPSSHSATVCGLTAGTGLIEGFDSPVFAVALFLAFIVMYDAMNVRMAAGEDGKAINLLNRRLKGKGEEPLCEKDLPEELGHTFPEVLAGMAVGIAAAIIVCKVIPWPW